MTRSARVVSGVVAEIVIPPAGSDIADILHPDLASQCLVCGDQVAPGWFYRDGDFVAPPPPDLDAAKAGRLKTLSIDCAAAITGGYLSGALGHPHTYPSGITDQINMMGSVTSSLLPGTAPDWSTPFWCQDAYGNWAFRLHSALQIQQAGADGKAHVVTCQALLEALNAQVMAASTADEIEAIVWPDQ